MLHLCSSNFILPSGLGFLSTKAAEQSEGGKGSVTVMQVPELDELEGTIKLRLNPLRSSARQYSENTSPHYA